MATALAYPNPEQGKRETSLKIKEVGLNAGYISQARFVLRHCRLEIDLVSPVSMHTLKRQLTRPEPD